MSGGRFDYKQHYIDEIADTIEDYLLDPDYKKDFSNDVKYRMKKAVKLLRKAHIYAQRIDYYMSGDDGEEKFLERLAQELEEIE